MLSLVFSLLIVGVIIGFCVWRNNKARKNALHGELNRELKALDDSMSEPDAYRYDVAANGESMLIKAVSEEKDIVVDWLLEKGVSPNTRDSGGVPVLSLAVKNDSLNIVKKLIGAGADVNAMDKQGNTALFFVKRVDVFQELIKAGAVVTVLNQDNQTPLFFAETSSEDDQLIAELVKQGMEPNYKDSFGKNALFYAKHIYSVKKLIQLGADPNAEDCEGKIPIFYINDRRLALELIRNGANLRLTDHQGNAIPILKHLRETLYSPEYNAFPNVYDWRGLNRDLVRAVTERKLNDVKELLKQGADPNCYESDSHHTFFGTRSLEQNSNNMMTMAIRMDAPEIIQLLVDAGANVYQINCGLSPLMRAAQKGLPQCFDMLIKLGADPKEDSNFSFEQICSCFNNKEMRQYSAIIKKILDCGVKRTKEVWKAAIEKGNPKLIDILLNYCPEVSGACMEIAVQKNNKQAWMWQTENGFPINSSIVSTAVCNDNFDFIKCAVKNGFQFDDSVISIIIEKDKIEFLKYAVKKGAVCDIRWLDKALSCKSSSCAVFMLEQGVIPETCHIWMAVKNNMVGVFQRMHSTVKERDDKLLEDVCLDGNFNVIKLLVESGWTLSRACLVNAVKNGNSECIQYIIEHDIKPDRSILDMALRLNNKKTAKIIIHCGVKPTPADLTAALNDNRTAIAEMLIKEGVELNDSHLKLALEKKNTKCVSTLINKGVEPDCVDLYTCINNEDIQSARAILKSDKLYSFDITDALEYAEKYSECKGIKKLLKRYDETGEI